MKKLIYVSGEDFFDVDFPILKELNKEFDLIWIPILRRNGWYSMEEISTFGNENNICVKPIVQKYKYKHPMMVLFYIKILLLIKKLNPDAVYFEYFGVPLLHMLTPFFLSKSKLVFAIHDVEQHYRMDYGNIKGLYFHCLIKYYSHFQVFSKSQMTLFKQKYPNKNVFMADLCLKDFGKPIVVNREGSKINFLFFGIIRKNKGLDILIEACNNLYKQRNDFHLTIAGNSKNWTEYENLLENKEMYTLHIRKIENSEISSLFCGTDFLILPYIDVTQSGVLLTSYFYNVPAIASDLEGFKEYIEDGVNGHLFRAKDVNSLEKKLESILNCKTSTHNTIRKNLKIFVEEKINQQKIGAKYSEFINKI